MTIFDCTLRDGGYYTQWDFDKPLVDQYITALNKLPIDYIEVGYRSPLQSSYFGKYFYLPLYELKSLREQSNKKLSVMLNEKHVGPEHLPKILKPIVGLVDIIRMAVKPHQLDRAIALAKEIKKYGFKVGFNMMYMSKWKDDERFIHSLDRVNGVADVLYIVDSYGGGFPHEVKRIVQQLKPRLDCQLGFHGHNNLETALTNTLAALEAGVACVDSTILGMGRGAGNLKTELLLTVLSKEKDLKVNFNALEKAIAAIEPLYKKDPWGPKLPYMISGANSLPQDDVMERITVRYYTLNDVIRSLNDGFRKARERFPHYAFKPAERILIVGGGPLAKTHIKGIKAYLNKNPDIVIVHASSKTADSFKDLPHKRYYCLVGNEGQRLKRALSDLSDFDETCILPPFPITKQAYVPDEVTDQSYELESISFADKYHEAHTAIAIQTALNCKPKQILITGYDGYSPESLGPKEKKLIKENEYLFNKMAKYVHNYMSLTPTNYSLPANNNLFYKLSL